jgi:peptide/nickel transport system substrate-binding protein
MRLDATLQPQLDLASEWQATPDGRTITFTLRSDLRWHDNTPLTSADVAYTLTALNTISPTTALLSDLTRIEQVTTPTSTTVELTLNERYAPIFSVLTLPILPKHLLIDKAIDRFDFWDAPIGSGPFRLEERRASESIVLAANPSFHRGAPLLDRVVFVVAPDPQISSTALREQQLLVGELPWPAAEPLRNGSLQQGRYAENGYYFVAYNMRSGRPTADLRVRQAIRLSIDLPQLVQDVTASTGQPIGNSAAPGSWADLTPPLTSTVDLARARLLLDEAGWKLAPGSQIRQQNGITLTLQLFVRGDDPRRTQAAEQIARAAQQIGIAIEVEPSDFETVIRSKYAPPYDFDLLLGSWSNGAADPLFADYAYYDPDDFALFHSSQINQGTADTRPVLNIGGFRDPSYDNQAAAARQLYEVADRTKALAQAQTRVAELQPYLFLWADTIPVFINQRVTTLDGPIDLNSPMYLWNIERWYLN